MNCKNECENYRPKKKPEPTLESLAERVATLEAQVRNDIPGDADLPLLLRWARRVPGMLGRIERLEQR